MILYRINMKKELTPKFCNSIEIADLPPNDKN